jgi:ABC-type multidrug transport system ATPase subunit
MDYIIDIENLTYRYNDKFKALDNVSIKVPKGAIYGFLGPNGAGKSTTIRMITGIMPDDANNIKLFGNSLSAQIPEVYHRVGALVEQPVLYQHLTAHDHLLMICKSNNIDDASIDEILAIVGLSHATHLTVKRYSLGMKQRLAIALCLIKNPELLILDEPVNGLDPNGMQELRALLVKLNKEKGITIFVSSHLLAEIEKMCTHICIINKGKIHFDGKMEDLQLNFRNSALKIKVGTTSNAFHIDGFEYSIDGNLLQVHIHTEEDIPQIVQQLVSQNVPVYGVAQTGNLESWFMQITQ